MRTRSYHRTRKPMKPDKRELDRRKRLASWVWTRQIRHEGVPPLAKPPLDLEVLVDAVLEVIAAHLLPVAEGALDDEVGK